MNELKVGIEVLSKRGENSKTFDLGSGKFRLEIGGAHAHYKDNYADAKEQWKEVDLTIVDNKITKAPYILEIDGDKYTVTDKKTGKASVVERLDKDTDFKLIPGTHTIRFQTTIREEKDLKDLKYKISGDIPVVYSAYDADDDEIDLDISVKDGVVIESVIGTKDTLVKDGATYKKGKTAVKYPIKIDPTLTVQGSGQDTFIEQDTATTNYGSETRLEVACWPSYQRRSIVSLPVSDLPALATVDTAELGLYYYAWADDDPAGETVYCWKLRRNDWVEAQATWNIYKTGSDWGTAGANNTSTDIDSSIAANSNVPASYGWQTWNVKSHVENAVSTSVNFNCRLHRTEAEVGGNAKYYSKNYATDTTKRPKLVIEYTTPLPIFMYYYQNIMR